MPTVDEIDALLPQTQCTRCGYPDCRSYAQAIAGGEAGINRCPPGGPQGIERLARLTGQAVVALDPSHGQEGPVHVAVIDETWCIGCTLCIQACPVDCIVGATRQMHTVIEPQCTGCELCVPACPVDCIALVDSTPGRSGWAAWSLPQAQEARTRHLARGERQRQRDTQRAEQLNAAPPKPPTPLTLPQPEPDSKRQIIEAVLARARAAAARR